MGTDNYNISAIQDIKLWRIYRLYDKRIAEVTKYIGMTSTSLTVRLANHVNDSYKSQSHNYQKRMWIQSLRYEGIVPTIEEIDHIVGTKLQAEERERFYVYHYLSLGQPLLNITYIPSDRQHFIEFLIQERLESGNQVTTVTTQ